MLLHNNHSLGMDDVKVPPFEDGGLWKNPLAIGEGWRHFRVGECTGLYRARGSAYEILAVANNNPGNGHVEAALGWFFSSCKRDKMNLVIREVMNKALVIKLARLGFTCYAEDNYIKRFTENK